MSVFDMIENAAKALADPFGFGATEVAKGLVKGSITTMGQGSMSPETLVRTITQGAGPQGFDDTAQDHRAKAQTQDEIGAETRRHMTTLESAWTGQSAEAAQNQLKTATSPVDQSSQAMTTTATTINGQVEAFTTLRNSLHTDVTDQAPQKSTWDSLTPWDTDTEKAINDHNAKVQANLDMYNNYTTTTQSYAPQLATDYGQATQLPGGDFQIQQPNGPVPRPGGPTETGNINHHTGTANVPSATGHPSDSGTTAVDRAKTSPVAGLDPNNFRGTLDDSTRAAGYTPPESQMMRGPGNPGGYGSFGPGGSSDFSGGGFGPGGSGGGAGGGFGPGGSGGGARGGFGPGGSGSAAGGGSLTGGKGVGGGMASEHGAGGAGAAAKAGAAGRSGANGMGGMGGGKGQGGEDSEHQRASYLVEPDADSIFGTSEKTPPPVIGL